MIIYVQNPKDSKTNNKKQFIKVAGYKLDMKKNNVSIHKQQAIQKENQENHFIHNNNKENKIFRNNLTKEVKDLYTENRKTLIKEIKEDTDN